MKTLSVRLNIRINDEEKAQLEKIAEAQDISLSQLIRRLIKNYLQENL